MALKLHSGYMSKVYESTELLIEEARAALQDADYDTLVGTGLSGSLVIPILARGLGAHWLIVRKPNDGSHSGYRAEGNLGERWLFVDDFISSGTTKRRVQETVSAIMQGRAWHRTDYVGDYLYQYTGQYIPV